MKTNKSKFLLGAPIGVAVLMISYLLVYLLEGNTEYVAEISQLVKPEILLNQIIWSSVTYLALGFVFQCFEEYANRENNDVGKKKIVKFFIAILVYSIVVFLMDKIAIFVDEMVVNTFLGLGTISIIISITLYVLKTNIEINKINKKLNTKK